jgi:hypothetical protein
VSASPSTPVLRQDVVVRYEELRQDVLSRSDSANGIGFTLFLREGMTRWMRVGACAPSPRSQSESTAIINRWSCDVRAQAAAILAGILLSYRTEATPCMPTGRR